MKKTKIVLGTDESGMFTQVRKLFTILLICVCCSSGLEAANGTLCAATTSKNAPCKMNALNGSKFCQFHDPANHCAGVTAKGQPCKQMHEKGSKYCRFHQSQAK